MHRIWSARQPRMLLLVALAATCCLAFAGSAAAASQVTTPTISQNVWGGSAHVPGFRLTPRQVIAIAATSPKVQRELRTHSGLTPGAFSLTGQGYQDTWQVTWIKNCGIRCHLYAKTAMSDQVMSVYVKDNTGRILSVWTGLAAQTDLARGDPSYVGYVLNASYVWIPLCLLFLIPFVDRRRPFRLLHLDLLVLLGFSVSQFFFARGNVGVSVPLVYPVLAYLLVRMLYAGFRPRRSAEPLVPWVRSRWLLVGIVVLVAFRIGLDVADSNILDVGAAGSVGANQIIHGGQLYDGSVGRLVGGGDTYGPANYLAYVPFRLVLHSGDEFDNAAIRGAAIFFDLLTLAGLFVLGRRLRAGPEGTKMGLALGYAWAAFPYSALALSENTNDTLIAALLVWTMVVLLSPWRRGIVLAVGSLVKFVPLALVPLIATGKGPRTTRAWLTFGLAFAATALVLIVPFVPPSSVHRFYSLTLGAQLHRKTPLSLWGQAPSLEALKYLLSAATVGLGIFLAFRPAVRSRAQVAAFSAALLIAIQICVSYWYYTYVVWFAPLAFVALFAQYRLGDETPEQPAEALDAVERRELAVAEPVAG